MKKSEVIKLMKEGTHCIYNDCPEKEALLRKILNEVSNNRFNKKREVSTKEAFVMDNFNHIISFTYSDSVGYKKINLSEIEPDNEKTYKMKSEIIKEVLLDMLNHMKDQKAISTHETIADNWAKIMYMKLLPEVDIPTGKPYLFYEGEKYYFGEEYEFKYGDGEWESSNLNGYVGGDEPFITEDIDFTHIRKIDHTTKYKKLLLELKEQAEKDGVNLKELI